MIKKIIKNILAHFGLKALRLKNEPKNVLIKQKINILLDVGANIGQYAKQAKDNGYMEKIISFEPLLKEHKILIKESKKYIDWQIYKRCAIGSNSTKSTINISKNSFSSSLLPMLKSHEKAAPNSIYIAKSNVDVINLDSIFSDICKKNERVFLKIDTQGFEFEVLKGFSKNLKNVVGVQLELSTIPLYKKQKMYKYFLNFFERNDFFLWQIIPGFSDPETGQMLQFDAIFINNSKNISN